MDSDKPFVFKSHFAVLVACFLFLICLVLCGFFEAGFGETNYNYFGYLGQSMLDGRLDTPELKEQLDVSFYQDKVYLYWGPAAGVAFSFGSLVTGFRLSDRVMATVLLAVNFYLWYTIVFQMCRSKRSSALEFALLVAFACCGGLFITQFETPAVWQMGHIFAYTGMSLVVFGLYRENIKLKTAVLGFCLAVLSRSSLLILTPGLLLLAIALLQKEGCNVRQSLGRTAVPTAMFIGTLVLLGGYNYLRFDDVQEFGQNHKSDIPFYRELALKHGTVSIQHVPRNAYIYFVNPIRLSLAPPHLIFDGRGNAIWSYYPLVILPFVFLLFSGRRNLSADDEKLPLCGILFLALWAIYLMFLCCLVWTGYFNFGGRYLCDVEPLLQAVILVVFLKLKKGSLPHAASIVGMLVSIEIKLAYLFIADGIF